MKEGTFLRRCLPLAAPWPALVVGALVMARSGLPPLVWGQNLAAGLGLTTVCAVLPGRAVLRSRFLWWSAVVPGALGLLAATFLDRGFEGVHRWVQAGPLRVHVGAVCLPSLLLALGATPHVGGWQRWRAVLIGGVALALLVAQPDAAQTTAFAGALLALAVSRREPRHVLVPVALVCVAAAVWVWRRPDPLLPVPHVEGIVGLAARNGLPWLVGALLALALVPCPFLLAARRGGAPVALAMGAYYSLCILGSFLGAFPVPVMGFGLSPVLGYFVALGWLPAAARRTGS